MKVIINLAFVDIDPVKYLTNEDTKTNTVYSTEGELLWEYPPTPEQKLWLNELARTEKVLELARDSQAVADGIIYSYPEFERITWDRQKIEATKYLESGETGTAEAVGEAYPILSQISIKRGMPMKDLSQAVLDNATRFEPNSGGLAGRRQTLVEELYKIDLNDEDALDKINAIKF